MMDRSAFESAVMDERLARWVQFGRPTGASADKVCVVEDDGVWRTLMTDERAGVVESTRREFATESDALADALDAARMFKAMKNLRA